MKRFLQILLIGLLPIVVLSQTLEEKKVIIKDYNTKNLNDLAKTLKSEAELEKSIALEMARQNGWPVRYEENGALKELMKVSEEGNPLYYITNNVNAAKSTRANTMHNGALLGLNVEGQDMEAHVWDAGLARTTHQEYDGIGGSNRFSIGDGTTTLHYHSAHVTGTIIASGYVANAKGMAPQAEAVGYDWNSDVSEATTAAGNGMLLSNHSYGWGAEGIPDWYFGAYHSYSRQWDVLMHSAPYYLMVCSAGNDGQDNSSNGNPLNGNSSYDKLSGFKTTKNNLVVANANDANINASGNLISVNINSSSSEGPTDDYRIKPDITGNGTSLYSTFESYNSEYGNLTGTSMASPNVCGTLLLLQQHYNNLNSGFMKAATLKGLALHTADDAGPAGPDAIWGWGLLNAKEAANTITNNGVESTISELSLSQGNSHSITINSDGVNDLIASISWTDPAGTANNGTANDNTPVLVNDLDIRVTTGGSTYYPYRLTSITTNGTGDNVVDPFEKVIVSGASGTYTITVTHKGSLAGGSQNFTLIVTGKSIEPAAPEANFSANIVTPSIGQTVNFSDLSSNVPTSWQWTFSGPGNAVFVNGTNANSTNPKVQFGALGFYTASLYISNAIGNDTETKIDYIQVIDAGALNPPTNLSTQVLNENDVMLNWTAPSGGGGGTEELIYDNDVSTGSYTYNGYVMSTQMSPSGACKVLTMKFHTSGVADFEPTLFGWDGSQPGTDILYQETATTVNGDWLEIDISAENITFSGDFVVGFGSINEVGAISFDANLDNGRSWDYDNAGGWGAWNEAYLIRAIVEYTDGTVAEIGTGAGITPNPILKSANNSTHPTDYSQVNTVKPIDNQASQAKELLGYKVYRDGVFVDFAIETTYTDMDLESGTYAYCVKAVYDEGESVCSNTATAIIEGCIPEPPSNLTATIIDETNVEFSWVAPECEDLLGYNIYRNNENIGYSESTDFLDENLENGTYDYCVTAVYDEEETDCSNTATVTISVCIPEPPTNLTAAIIDEINVEVLWVAPECEDLLGYNVYYSLNSGTYNLLDFVTQTNYTHPEPGMGLHCYKVTAVHEEGDSDPSNVSCETLTSIGENISNSLTIYPNPATNHVNINSDYTIESVTVYNFAGQRVLTETVNNTAYSISTSSLQSGIYEFHLETEKGRISKRIVID